MGSLPTESFVLAGLFGLMLWLLHSRIGCPKAALSFPQLCPAQGVPEPSKSLGIMLALCLDTSGGCLRAWHILGPYLVTLLWYHHCRPLSKKACHSDP